MATTGTTQRWGRLAALAITGVVLAGRAWAGCYEPPPDRMMRGIKTTVLPDPTGKAHDIGKLEVRDRIRAQVGDNVANFLRNFVRDFDVERLRDRIAGQIPQEREAVEYLARDVQAFVASLGGLNVESILIRDPAARGQEPDTAKGLFIIKALSEYAQPLDPAELGERALQEATRLDRTMNRVSAYEPDKEMRERMELLEEYALLRRRHYRFSLAPTRDDLQDEGSGPVRGDSSDYMENLASVREYMRNGRIPFNQVTTDEFMQEQAATTTIDEATGRVVPTAGTIWASVENGLLAQRPVSAGQAGRDDPYSLDSMASGAAVLATEYDSLRPDMPLDLLRHKLGQAAQTILYIDYYEGPPGTQPTDRGDAVQVVTTGDTLSGPGQIKVPERVTYRVIEVPIYQHLHNDATSATPDAVIPLEEQILLFEKMVDAVDTPVTLAEYPVFPVLTAPGPPGVNTRRVVALPPSFSGP